MQTMILQTLLLVLNHKYFALKWSVWEWVKEKSANNQITLEVKPSGNGLKTGNLVYTSANTTKEKNTTSTTRSLQDLQHSNWQEKKPIHIWQSYYFSFNGDHVEWDTA